MKFEFEHMYLINISENVVTTTGTRRKYSRWDLGISKEFGSHYYNGHGLWWWTQSTLFDAIWWKWCKVSTYIISSFIRFQIQLFVYTFSGLVKNFNVCTHVKQITLWTQNWINRTQITTKMEKLKLDVTCPKNMFVRPHVMHTLPMKWPYLF